MKYITFKPIVLPRGVNDFPYQVILCPDHVVHASISIFGYKPISAGFWMQDKGVIKTYGESESLGLKPHLRDKHLISLTIVNAGTSFFLSSNPILI